jgi:asparagine synthase (glutamine-hydrolysing)
MAFIHGEISWVDPPQVVRAAVERMQAVVEHFPWGSTETRGSSSVASTCLLVVQRRPRDRASPASDGSASVDGLEVVADLRLDEPRSLGADLGLEAASASTVGPAELAGRAYLRWGRSFGEHVVGDGALALWDAGAQSLVCWRDAAGVRPFYYFHRPGERFVFSSDLRALAAHPAARRELDLAYVRGMLESGGEFHHPTRTLVSGVRKLPPGHCLVVDASGLRLERYWYPDRVTPHEGGDVSDYVDELRTLLTRAVQARMVGPCESIGAHLSGGLDSSSVAAVAAGRSADAVARLRAFSWAPSWQDLPAVEGDERHLVEAVAASRAIEVRYARLCPADILEVICRDVALEPENTLHYELASSRDGAALDVRTMLSGWGGDETVAFNGRGYFAALARRGRFVTIQREFRQRSTIHGGRTRGAWKSRVLMPLLPDAALRTVGWLDGAGAACLPAELRPEFARHLEDVEPLQVPRLRERPGVRQTQLALLDHGHLQYRMESWASHGATLGITYAFPLLDRRLVEFALSVPDHLYFRDGWKRWLYRSAMEGILPESVRWNANKSDDAMAQQYTSAKRGIGDGYRERLLERKDNAFVDVDVLLAAAEGSPPDDAPVGDAAWLAFTELLPS